MKLISLNSLSLFCAILLCIPLALVLTIYSNYYSTILTLTVTHDIVTLSTSPQLLKPISNSPKILPPKISDCAPPIRQPLIRQFSPPPSPPQPVLEDDNDDIDLLRRATCVNPYTLKGHLKKVAFLFLTTTPLPFAQLWELFFSQNSEMSSRSKYNIYIHADPTARYDPPFTGVFSGRVIPSSKPTRRNTPTLTMAARRLLAHALLDDPNNHMFIILSSSCIPLHSFNFIYTFLVSSNKSFVEISSNATRKHTRWEAHGGEHVMLPEVSEHDFRVGSQFWSLTRRQARIVVEDTKLWKKFRLPCVDKDECYPEENYFPTLLSMVDPHGVVPTTLTYVDWSKVYNGHPRNHKGWEVNPRLIRRLRERRPIYGVMTINNSDLPVKDRWDSFLFARKFAPNCLEPLLSIAKDVLFKD